MINVSECNESMRYFAASRPWCVYCREAATVFCRIRCLSFVFSYNCQQVSTHKRKFYCQQKYVCVETHPNTHIHTGTHIISSSNRIPSVSGNLLIRHLILPTTFPAWLYPPSIGSRLQTMSYPVRGESEETLMLQRDIVQVWRL